MAWSHALRPPTLRCPAPCHPLSHQYILGEFNLPPSIPYSLHCVVFVFVYVYVYVYVHVYVFRTTSAAKAIRTGVQNALDACMESRMQYAGGSTSHRRRTVAPAIDPWTYSTEYKRMDK